VSTSYVERHNLSMRMGMRRFTRLTNGFSKKIQNHAAMVAIYAVHYNFARIHKTLRITPAMACGLSDHVWSLDEIVMMVDSYTPAPKPARPLQETKFKLIHYPAEGYTFVPKSWWHFWWHFAFGFGAQPCIQVRLLNSRKALLVLRFCVTMRYCAFRCCLAWNALKGHCSTN